MESIVLSQPISWLPEELYKQEEKISRNDLKDIQLLSFYFGSLSEGRCTNFTPELIDFYTKINNEDKLFEVIFFSNDIDEDSFKRHYTKMPWLACPFKCFEQECIDEGCEINELPKLIVFSKNGQLVDESGQNIINEKKDFEEIFATWLSKSEQ